MEDRIALLTLLAHFGYAGGLLMRNEMTFGK
jgi:hypothetical protein